ncbi:MAG TPA: ABC transporter ATP-binding protein [Candidatus Limnocylindrales bacterium]|nr:ABC transporter ATP-binding protein [Candidatus Limnocylindrales bacterium]
MATGAAGTTSRRVQPIDSTKVAVRMVGVGKRYNGHDAVSGLDLEIPTGSVVGVIGPSGAGKTTTIRMITGSLAPTRGTAEVLGEPLGRRSRRTRERMGYLPQKFSLYPDLTVLENVDFVASLYGLLFARRFRRRRQVLELVDLWSVRGRRASALSGGMQRRLELAAALVHEPDLLVLDEPTAGIDPLLRRVVWDEVHRLKERGVTSVVTTQYVTEAEECDLVTLISEGRRVAFGTPDELRRMAFGGDLLEVTTERVFDVAGLGDAAGIHGVQQTGPRDFRLVVEDAGAATADVVQAITAAGADVAAVRESRPTFEEVFATLVERHRAQRAAATAEAGDGGGDGDGDGGSTAAAPTEQEAA